MHKLTDNSIGAEGAKALSETLKVKSTLTVLGLNCVGNSHQVEVNDAIM